MALKTSDLNAKLFGKANKRRASSPQEAQQAAKDKVNTIELAVAGEDNVIFELVKVPAQDIEKKTQVFAQNAREQTFLNEHALSDVLATLKEQGQQYPAVGRRIEDGTIEVLDGSRRRMSCILAQKDFLIYVGENIDSSHAKFLSDVANAHKPLSLYEKGREMQAKLDSKEVFDQKGLAELFQCSEALVSGALKAASLPLELLQVYPSVTELGRPTIVKLHKLYSSLDKAAKETFVAKCCEEKAQVDAEVSDLNIAQVTKGKTTMLETWFTELAPAQLSHKDAKQERVKGRMYYSQKGQNLTLNLKKVDKELAEEILSLVEAKLT